MAHPGLVIAMFGAAALVCAAVGAALARRAPAVAFGLLGAVAGGAVGFLVENADGPAEVPAYTTVGASIGLVVFAIGALVRTSARPPARTLRRAAAGVLVATPFAALIATAMLQLACPLYVNGPDAGFCDYQQIDLLGGWVSGVIVAFVFDALFIAAVLFASARQAGRAAAQTAATRSASARPSS